MEKKLEIQYGKTTTLKIEFLSFFQSSESQYAQVKCSLIVNGIPIASSTRAVGAGDILEFSYDQVIASILTYGGLDPQLENLELLKSRLLPRGDEDERGGVEGVSVSNQRSVGECEGDPEGDL